MLIGEVARLSGVSTRMLRHYDALGLVKPTGRTSGGYREYSPEDIRRLLHVESLRTLGLSLADAKRALDEPGFTPAELMSDLIAHTQARITAEAELLAKLVRVNATAPAAWDDVMSIITLLRALESDSAGRRQQAVLTADADRSLPGPTLAELALAEDNPNVAGALRWSLARAAGHGLTELAAGLESGDRVVRLRAISAIAEVQAAEATTLLRHGLTDDDAVVRSRAALALGARGSIDAVPALLEMVVEGEHDVEAAEALGLLAETAGEDIVEELTARFGAAHDADVRARITQALAEIPGPAAGAALVAMTKNDDRMVAATARAILRTRDRS